MLLVGTECNTYRRLVNKIKEASHDLTDSRKPKDAHIGFIFVTRDEKKTLLQAHTGTFSRQDRL